MTPIKLRTVRPFVIEELSLAEAAEEEELDLSDQMEISKFLKAKVNLNQPHLLWVLTMVNQVNALINQANQLWDERNAQAVEEGEEELPRMLPLVRLKVRFTAVK